MLLRRLALTGAALTTLALAGCSTSDTTASAPATTAPAPSHTAASTASTVAVPSSSTAEPSSGPAEPTAPSSGSVTTTRSTTGTTTGGSESTSGTSPTTAPGSAGCSPLVVGEDGTVSPLFCAGDTVNPAAVAYYEGANDRGFDPAVLRLPSSASRTTVVQTVCSDLAPGSAMGEQTEQQAYELAAQRADWYYELNVVALDC